MKFIDIPTVISVKSSQNIFEINTIQSFEETEDKVIISCAEFVPQFIKGFVCDLDIKFRIRETDDFEIIDYTESHCYNLVLVYIPKNAEAGSYTQFEYIFYK
jgi:hypothetical protein